MISLAVAAAGWVGVGSPGDYAARQFLPLPRHDPNRSWNFLAGCTILTPGCTNCYAMQMAARIERMSPDLPHYRGLTKPSKAGPVWTGKIGIAEAKLLEPLRVRKPAKWFVNSMSDLFHEDVPDAIIDKAFAVMALCPQHTFQILTKRSARMREYLQQLSGEWKTRLPSSYEPGTFRMSRHELIARIGETTPEHRWAYHATLPQWLLPNVWLGVSVEDQKRADERIPHLLATPAAVRWISAEPLLGALDLLPYLFIYTHADQVILEETPDHIFPELPWRDPATTPEHEIATPRLDWVVVGGESGRGARPMHPDWVRSIRDQCAEAKVPFFFKQWGEYREVWTPAPELIDDETERADELYASAINPSFILRDGTHIRSREELWCVDVDNPARLIERVGKGRAGRLLDGREHNEFPATA